MPLHFMENSSSLKMMHRIKYFLLILFLEFARAPNSLSKEVAWLCPEAGDCYISVTETNSGIGKSWTEAREICRSLNSTLPILDNPTRSKGFGSALNNLTSLYNYYWIGANAYDDGGATWLWLDGSKYNGTVVGGPWTYNRSYACVGLSANQSKVSQNSTFQTIASAPTDKYPYICQLPYSGNINCVNKTGQTTYRTGNVCYVVYNQALGWFNARNNCLEQGGDLAFLRNEGDQSTFKMMLGAFGADRSTLRFWIGLRSSWWSWTDATTGLSEDVIFSYWTSGQPNGNYAQCISTYDISDEVPTWRDWDCTDSLPFICQAKRYSDASRSTVYFPLSPATEDNYTRGTTICAIESSAQKSVSVIPLAVGIGVGVGIPLLIAIVVIVVVIVRRQRRKSNKSQSQSTTATQEGHRPALEPASSAHYEPLKKSVGSHTGTEAATYDRLNHLAATEYEEFPRPA